jgi:hypothetical protein
MWILEAFMNRKALVIGGIAAIVVLAGGWALAQTAGHDHAFGHTSCRDTDLAEWDRP